MNLSISGGHGAPATSCGACLKCSAVAAVNRLPAAGVVAGASAVRCCWLTYGRDALLLKCKRPSQLSDDRQQTARFGSRDKSTGAATPKNAGPENGGPKLIGKGKCGSDAVEDVQKHPGDAKCVTEIFGHKNRKLGGI